MRFIESRWAVCIAVLALAVAGCRADDKQPAAAQQPAANPIPAASAPRQVAAVESPPASDGQFGTGTSDPSQGQSFAGWYMEHAGQGMFQACGDSKHIGVSGATEELRKRASAFGLEENIPVYVRLIGVQTASGDAIEVSRVEQFGSDTPVRDCGLTGVVIPAPANN